MNSKIMNSIIRLLRKDWEILKTLKRSSRKSPLGVLRVLFLIGIVAVFLFAIPVWPVMTLEDRFPVAMFRLERAAGPLLMILVILDIVAAIVAAIRIIGKIYVMD